ncbi:hypothetical protein HPP92_029148 [Vanilla planifolia]|uniref:Uncharacterized protein n=1 Tax=Vanilla planifolia TaxID=51239 RepID=A0A835P5B0_VANPL|nr:hypothetical protein HPP92_029148 [Vanilla planifolia]KAG0445826.1 hypothetical protein HPP92_029137 [Vanilla planifolia]
MQLHGVDDNKPKSKKVLVSVSGRMDRGSAWIMKQHHRSFGIGYSPDTYFKLFSILVADSRRAFADRRLVWLQPPPLRCPSESEYPKRKEEEAIAGELLRRKKMPGRMQAFAGEQTLLFSDVLNHSSNINLAKPEVTTKTSSMD